MKYNQIKPSAQEMEFIIKYPKLVDWLEVVSYFNIPLSLVAQNSEYLTNIQYFWEKYLLRVKVDPEEFVHTVPKSKISWTELLRNYKLSEKLLTEIIPDINEQDNRNILWAYISINQTLSEKFIIDHKSEVKWKNIAEYQNLSEEFIASQISYGNLSPFKDELLENQIMSYDIIVKYFKPFNFEDTLARNRKAPLSILNIFMSNNAATRKREWATISAFHELTPEFLSETLAHNQIDLHEVCKNETLTVDSTKIILDAYDWIDWDNLLQYHNDIFVAIIPTLNKDQLELLAKKWER